MLNKVRISDGALYGCNIILNADDLFQHLWCFKYSKRWSSTNIKYLYDITSLHHISVEKYYPTLYAKCDNHNCLFRSFVTFQICVFEINDTCCFCVASYCCSFKGIPRLFLWNVIFSMFQKHSWAKLESRIQ